MGVETGRQKVARNENKNRNSCLFHIRSKNGIVSKKGRSFYLPHSRPLLFRRFLQKGSIFYSALFFCAFHSKMAKESFKSCPAPALALENTAAGGLRRHSTGKSSLKTKDYVPNYLRASTGSCHDLCKYGKHVAEESQVLSEKNKRSTLAKSKPLPNGESRNKASLIKVVKSVPISRTRLSGGLQLPKLKTRASDRVPLSLKSTSKAEDSNISAKRGSSINSKFCKMKILQSTSNRVGVKKIVTGPLTSSRPVPGGVASSKPRKQWNLEIFSPRDNENKITEVKQHDHDEVQEKILYVITKGTENLPSESDQNDGFDQYESFGAGLSPPSPSTEEEDNQEESMGNETAMSLECTEMAKKVQSEDTTEHEKLSFRRGKVVDIQCEDLDGPRRLEFRRGTLWEKNQTIKINTVTKSFKPREAEAETNGGNAGSEQVVLRHQDVVQKKDAKGLLLNNVIEETASKLGGMQKSKVKALVGAFETVISLQDPKPLATTTVN